MKKVLTLCFIHEHPRILLGMKKRGFGVGKWNGFGGKIMLNESIETAAKRELFEEAGVEADDLKKVGMVEFEYLGNQEILEVHIFRVKKYSGVPEESEEMRPQWFHIDDIPFDNMWPDDRHWLPLFLQGKKFKGRFLFGEADAILEQELCEAEEELRT